MNVVAHAVLDFSSAAGGGQSANAQKNHAISATPQQLTVSSTVLVEIYSSDIWSISCHGAYVPGRQIDAAQFYDEIVVVQGSQQISTQLPVQFIISSQAQTPIVDGDTQQIVTPAGGHVSVRASNGYAYFDRENVIGAVRLQYKSYQRQWWRIHSFLRAGIYVIFARNQSTGEVEQIILTVEEAESGNEPALVTINVRDYCTDGNIAGAAVYIDGSFKGNTDANGLFPAGILAPGTYALRITAPGYLSTDEDDLVNDSFTV